MRELRPAVRNAADKEQVKEAQKNAITQRDAEVSDFKEVVRLPAGRRMIAKYLRRTGVFEDTYHPDSNEHSRVAGIRWVGLQLLQDVKEADPTVLLEALQNYMDEENDGRENHRNKQHRRSRKRG